MSVLKGDFLGFTYNGIHSSDLGIVRTSNGSRFDENLLPTIQDKTVQVPGGDGTYYFGSYYTQRQFNIPFAFDSLTESQVEFLRAHFGDKKPHPLVFDESPYKTYSAKVTGTATIKYVPFDDKEVGRVYKGEGNIQFTCYQPFAVCNKKYLEDYTNPNKKEWSRASGLLENKGIYDTLQHNDNYTLEGSINLYNPGVKEADWVFAIKAKNAHFPSGLVKIGKNDSMVFGGCGVKTKNGIADNRITFNSKTGLIEGWYTSGENYVKSGNIYNEYITGGDFYKIPVTITKTPNGEIVANDVKVIFSSLFATSDVFESFEYDYYYY